MVKKTGKIKGPKSADLAIKSKPLSPEMEKELTDFINGRKTSESKSAVKTKSSLKMRKLISDEPSHWIDEAEWYSENESWLEKSAIIALNILTALRKQSVPKTIFAKMIGVSPQYARKILKGKANLTLKTIATIEKTLGITLQEIPAHKNSRINKKGSNSVYKLSEFQIQRIEQAREQIRNGQGIPDEEVQAEVECLLDPRPLSKEDKQKISEFIKEGKKRRKG